MLSEGLLYTDEPLDLKSLFTSPIISTPNSPIFTPPNFNPNNNITMTTPKDIHEYFEKNPLSSHSNILRVEPFSGDGTQDPIPWMTAFEKAMMVNLWEDKKLIRMISAYLQDEAEEWWTAYYNDNEADKYAVK